MPEAELADSRPRVLMLIKGLGIGGAERLISRGARFWSTSEFDYRVAYILPWKDQLVPDLTSIGIDTICIGESTRSFAAPAQLRRLVRSWRPSLIHAHLPAAGVVARSVTLTPIVYTEHNLADSYRTLTRMLNRATYGRNRAVVAVSDAVADSLVGYPGPKPQVIPNGVVVAVSEERRHAIRHDLGIDPDQPLVVHVGNIRPGKGHTTLIKAAHLIRKSVPSVVVVSIGVEKHPGDLDRVRREASREDAGFVRFLGRRPDAVDFIAGADVFVNPSDVEGLPLVVLEAMMAGTPVVATDAGGVHTVLRDGETGRLVPTGQPAALAHAVTDVLADPEAAKSMAQQAQDLVEAEFSLARMVAANEDLYRRVLGE